MSFKRGVTEAGSPGIERTGPYSKLTSKYLFPQVTDTSMRLFNDTREEDHVRMAELVIKKMEAHYPPTDQPSSPTTSVKSGRYQFSFLGFTIV
jgi:hypothetical protein